MARVLRRGFAAAALLGVAACGDSAPAARSPPRESPLDIPIGAAASPDGGKAQIDDVDASTAELGAIGEGEDAGGSARRPRRDGSAAGVSRVPQIRQGAMTVTGRLPPEVISRIVRQNFGRFRMCYEKGLQSAPTLQGRITVAFVIDASGAVTSAKDGGSDLPDSGTIACVVGSFTNVSFPAPERGDVKVVYPIHFATAAP